MTKTELDELVERAMAETSCAAKLNEDQVWDLVTDMTEFIGDYAPNSSVPKEHESQAELYRRMAAAALRGAELHEQRARQLRANEAHEAAKRDEKRVCKNCRAVEGDGRPGCVETFPAQHKWEVP